MKHPKLSIIVPVYNAEGSIKKLCGSILEQDFEDFALILVNDGSTDDTARVIQEIAKDSRVKVLDKPNGGPSSARNVGLDHASGEFVAFYDADDQIPEGSLGLMYEKIVSTDADIVAGGWRTLFLSENGSMSRTIETIPQEQVVSSEIIDHTLVSIGENGVMYNLWNKLFRMEIIKKNNLRFDENLRFGEDLLFIFDFVTSSKAIAYLPEISYLYSSGVDGSVFSTSSLSPEYRKTNAEGLEQFAAGSKNQKTKDLAAWVQSRWLLSYSMLVQKSSLPRKDKIGKLNEYPLEFLTPINSSQHIGKKKLLLHKIIYKVRDRPQQLLLLAGGVNLLKKLR